MKPETEPAKRGQTQDIHIFNRVSRKCKRCTGITQNTRSLKLLSKAAAIKAKIPKHKKWQKKLQVFKQQVKTLKSER